MGEKEEFEKEKEALDAAKKAADNAKKAAEEAKKDSDAKQKAAEEAKTKAEGTAAASVAADKDYEPKKEQWIKKTKAAASAARNEDDPAKKKKKVDLFWDYVKEGWQTGIFKTLDNFEICKKETNDKCQTKETTDKKHIFCEGGDCHGEGCKCEMFISFSRDTTKVLAKDVITPNGNEFPIFPGANYECQCVKPKAKP